jgi:hypothetical protein
MSRDFIVILAAVATLSVSALTPAIALARGAIALGGTGNGIGGGHGGTGNGVGGGHGGNGWHGFPPPPPNIGQGSTCCYTPPRGNKPLPK